MKAHLDKAAEQEKNNEGVQISLGDIWKWYSCLRLLNILTIGKNRAALLFFGFNF